MEFLMFNKIQRAALKTLCAAAITAVIVLSMTAAACGSKSKNSEAKSEDSAETSSKTAKSSNTASSGKDGLVWEEIEDEDNLKAFAYIDEYGDNELSEIYAVVWGKDKFVAGGEKGVMAYSSDGIKWTPISGGKISYSSNGAEYIPDIKAIAYGNGKFVAVCGISVKTGRDTRNVDLIAYSTDGIKWTLSDSMEFGTNRVHAITYGKDKFVALIDTIHDDKIYYSQDGITWTPTDLSGMLSAGDFLKSVAYGKDKFVAVSRGETLYSPDGITWTKIDKFIFYNNAVAWGKDKFVVVSIYGGRIATSKDGITWTEIDGKSIYGSDYDFRNNDPNYNIRNIWWGKDMFIAVGEGFGSESVLYSSDGIKWTLSSSLSLISKSTAKWIRSANAIAYGKDKFVAVGYGIDYAMHK